MPRVALTDSQRIENRLDDLCRSVIQAIEIKFMVKDKLNKRETAAALSLSPNTWCNWRSSNLDGSGSFRDVAKALDAAGYRITIEPKKKEGNTYEA